MNEPHPRHTYRIELSVKSALLLVSALASVWLFVRLWPVLLVMFVALMIAGMLNPFITRLEHRGLGRSYAIGIVFFCLFALAALVGVVAVPRFATQIADIAERLPATQADIAEQLDKSKLGAPIAKTLRETRSTELVASAERIGLSYSSKVVEVSAYAATSLFLALYLLVDRDRMRGMGFALFPRRYHVRVSRILINLETIVGGYLRGQVITSVMMAVFTFGLLSIFRVPNPIAFALFAGVVDVLPYVGGLLVCGPSFFAALSRGTTIALVVLLILAAYQEVESRFIVPRVYGKVLRLPAATVMISLLVGGKLLGIVGALLALPIAAGIRMVIEELRVELPGEVLDNGEERKRDQEGERAFERRAAGVPVTVAAAIATEIAAEQLHREAVDPAVPDENGPSK